MSLASFAVNFIAFSKKKQPTRKKQTTIFYSQKNYLMLDIKH
jgi:hypothetical protein